MTLRWAHRLFSLVKVNDLKHCSVKQMLGHLHRGMMSVIFALVSHQHPTGFQGHKILWKGCEHYGGMSQREFS